MNPGIFTGIPNIIQQQVRLFCGASNLTFLVFSLESPSGTKIYVLGQVYISL